MDTAEETFTRNVDLAKLGESCGVCLDTVEETFDAWALNGRAELMQREHGKNVVKFLQDVSFDRPFTFLDVGCGNGWVVRMIAEKKNCKKAVGIDKSGNMVAQAGKKSRSKKEAFLHTDIESWEYKGGFDFVFSMESLYYADSIKAALEKIYSMLNPGGVCFCGTDFYAENRATAKWADAMKVRMHLHSKDEWVALFEDAGFATSARQVTNPADAKKWKRDMGTLFITGTKP